MVGLHEFSPTFVLQKDTKKIKKLESQIPYYGESWGGTWGWGGWQGWGGRERGGREGVERGRKILASSGVM